MNCQHCDILGEIKAIRETLDALKHSVEGNGRAGLRERVEMLERWRAGIVAVLAFVMAAAGLYAKLKTP